MQHTSLAAGRWNTLSLMEQLGNVGSEISRMHSSLERKNDVRFEAAFVRALELFDLTLADPKNRHRLREVCRAREVVCDFFAGNNEYQSTGDSLNRYFTQYGLAARLERHQG